MYVWHSARSSAILKYGLFSGCKMALAGVAKTQYMSSIHGNSTNGQLICGACLG